jgi:hypothetical protein
MSAKLKLLVSLPERREVTVLSDDQLWEALRVQNNRFLNVQGVSAALQPQTMTVYYRQLKSGVPAEKRGPGLPRGQPIQERDPSKVETGHEQLSVYQPRLPVQWAFLAQRKNSEERFLRVGRWVLRQAGDAERQYITLAGCVMGDPTVGDKFDPATGRQWLDPDYQHLFGHAWIGLGKPNSQRPINQRVRDADGGAQVDLPASLAVLHAALRISEPQRRPTCFVIYPMFLDLIDRGKSTWDLLTGGEHPIARGGGDSSPDEGDVKGREVKVFADWLASGSPHPGEVQFESVSATYTGGKAAGYPELRWVEDLTWRRLKSLADGNESSDWVRHQPTSSSEPGHPETRARSDTDSGKEEK